MFETNSTFNAKDETGFPTTRLTICELNRDNNRSRQNGAKCFEDLIITGLVILSLFFSGFRVG